MDIISKVKQKREFKGLPDSIVARVVSSVPESSEKEMITDARILLRKYFGVFLTNKIFKPKNITDYDAILHSHKSSLKRDYSTVYQFISDSLPSSSANHIIDIGCGVNGFSYPYLRDAFGDVSYLGIEAAKPIVDNTNAFFAQKEFSRQCSCVWGDLFDLSFVLSYLTSLPSPPLVFLFQVVDALEALEKDFSKTFLLALQKHASYIVLSLPVESLSGKTRFAARRTWLLDFIADEFTILSDTTLFGERFLVLAP